MALFMYGKRILDSSRSRNVLMTCTRNFGIVHESNLNQVFHLKPKSIFNNNGDFQNSFKSQKRIPNFRVIKSNKLQQLIPMNLESHQTRSILPKTSLSDSRPWFLYLLLILNKNHFNPRTTLMSNIQKKWHLPWTRTLIAYCVPSLQLLQENLPLYPQLYLQNYLCLDQQILVKTEEEKALILKEEMN